MAEAPSSGLSAASETVAIETFVNSPDFFQRLFEQLYEGVYFVDAQRRITYWNRAAHRISGYSAEEVTGHFCQDNILNHVDEAGTQLCFAKCPLMATIETGIPHECEVFLHHKKGHRVPVRVRVTPIRDTTGKVLGAIEMFIESGSTKQQSERAEYLQSRGFHDPLSGLGNRRYLEIELFKCVGDQALQAVATTLANSIGDSEILGRWSVDEFLILLPHASLEHLGDIAERCRALVERAAIQFGPERVTVTLSAGASCVDPLDTMELFIRRLENLLQRSKYAGRNRVTMK